MAERLLPPSASPLEVDLEQSMALYGDVGERDIPIDRLWRPEACPAALLPWLAWGLGVRRWDPSWPEQTRRDVIAGAIAAHRRRGTPAAVKRALDDIGAVYDLVERPGDVAHTFSVEVLNSNDLLGGTGTGELRSYIDDAKRFSSHYTLVASSSLSTTAIGIGIGVSAVQVADIALTIDGSAA